MHPSQARAATSSISDAPRPSRAPTLNASSKAADVSACVASNPGIIACTASARAEVHLRRSAGGEASRRESLCRTRQGRQRSRSPESGATDFLSRPFPWAVTSSRAEAATGRYVWRLRMPCTIAVHQRCFRSPLAGGFRGSSACAGLWRRCCARMERWRRRSRWNGRHGWDGFC